ncbi:MAG: hypothetical protein KBC64_00500 [Simkaniaceae bacterium]|nr:hypothetical protein [Simkaniaceae bacterium]
MGPIHSLGMALVGPGFMLGAFGFGVTAMHACFYVRDLRLDRRLSQLQEVRLSQLQGVINAAFAQLLQQAAQQQDVVRLVQESYQLTESVGG